MVDAMIVLKTASFFKTLAEYMGLIDSVHSDVKKLLHLHFNSAISNLEYAKNTTEFSNRLDYVKIAKNDFIYAIQVEQNENLISSYLGLAMCQYLLGETENVNNTLQRINVVECTDYAKLSWDLLKGGFIDMYKPLGPIRLFYNQYRDVIKGDFDIEHAASYSHMAKAISNRIRSFNEFKNKALAMKFQ